MNNVFVIIKEEGFEPSIEKGNNLNLKLFGVSGEKRINLLRACEAIREKAKFDVKING